MPAIALLGGYYATFLLFAGFAGWWIQGAPTPTPYFHSAWAETLLTIWTWILAPYAAVVIHELGHYWAARGAGMYVEAVVVFGIGWDCIARRFYREPNSMIGGYVKADSQFLTRSEHRRFILGGPMINLAVFVLALPLMKLAPTSEVQVLLISFACANGAFGALNMLPFDAGGLPSDGRQLRDLHRERTDDFWKRLAKKPPLR